MYAWQTGSHRLHPKYVLRRSQPLGLGCLFFRPDHISINVLLSMG
jgi:hypothetical protein